MIMMFAHDSLFAENAENVGHPWWKIAFEETSWKSDLYFYWL